MLTKLGPRCDGCGRLDVLHSGTFKPFSFGGKYRNKEFAIAGKDSMQAVLHMCPGCWPRFVRCTRARDFGEMSDGPFKKALREIAPTLKIDPPEKKC